MKSEFQDLRRRVDEVLKAVIIAAVWLTVVAVVCAAVPAFGAEPWEVRISSMTCYTDARFFDNWETRTTARISLDETNAVLNGSDLEVWSNGLRVASYPASTTAIDISGISKPSIKLVDRLTLERRTLLKSQKMSIASCSFMPPPDGTAWVWKTDFGFILQDVEHGPATPDPPFDWPPKLTWTIEEVEVVE